MADWPLLGDGQAHLPGTAATAQSQGQTITASGTIDTKGTYTNLLAAASNTVDSAGFFLWITPNVANSAALFLVDVAIGAAGSEQIIIPDLMIASGTNAVLTPIFFPIGIPSGTRIACRCQSHTASAALRVNCLLSPQGFSPSAPLSRLVAYGTLSSSTGTDVEPGGTANTKGSWAQITSGTTNPVQMLYVAASQKAAPSLGAGATWLIDIGVGAGGSEVVLLGNLPTKLGFATDYAFTPCFFPPFPVSLPASTRLAARAQCSTNDATNRVLKIALYGLD